MARSKRPGRLQPLLIGILLYVAVTAVCYFYGRLSEGLLVLLAFFYLIGRPRWEDVSKIQILLVAFAVIFSAIATVFAYLDRIEVSMWQLTRTATWIFLSFALLSLSKSSALEQKTRKDEYFYQCLRWFIFFTAISSTIEYIFGIPISPAVIRTGDGVSDAVRIYPVASMAILPIIMISLSKKDYLTVFAILVIAVISQGKTNIAVAFLFIVAYFMRSPLLFMAMIPIFFAALIGISASSRFDHFLTEGDAVRQRQIEDGLWVLEREPGALLIGIGYGTPYSLGYSLYGDDDGEKSKLYENSRFDIENMYAHVLVRHGILGSILIILIFFGAFREIYVKLLFLAAVGLQGFGGALFSSAGGVLFILSFFLIQRMLPRTRKGR